MNKEFLFVLGFIVFVLVLVICFVNKTNTEKENFIKTLKSQNCKVTEFIEAPSIIDNDQYKYVCKNRTYILNVDFSAELNK
ncbi:hypothetical protein ACQWTT_001168 [Acinetobacter baumannii]